MKATKNIVILLALYIVSYILMFRPTYIGYYGRSHNVDGDILAKATPYPRWQSLSELNECNWVRMFYTPLIWCEIHLRGPEFWIYRHGEQTPEWFRIENN